LVLPPPAGPPLERAERADVKRLRAGRAGGGDLLGRDDARLLRLEQLVLDATATREADERAEGEEPDGRAAHAVGTVLHVRRSLEEHQKYRLRRAVKYERGADAMKPVWTSPVA
jgi:hypothetical protein